jgi:dolichol-phosphate mannosyltransferase
MSRSTTCKTIPARDRSPDQADCSLPDHATSDGPRSGLPEVCVIIPVFNEAPNIDQLNAELIPAIRKLNAEIIVVDDGSTDSSGDLIQKYPAFRYLRIPHRGKSSAIRWGVAHTTSPYIVTIDADLQEDPADIPRVVRELKRGYDLVQAVRKDRKDDFIRKKLPSRVYNFLTLLIFGTYLRDINCGLRGFRTDSLSTLPSFEGSHRLWPLFISRSGGSVKMLAVRHRPRRAGESKYHSPRRFVTALLDILRVWKDS